METLHETWDQDKQLLLAKQENSVMLQREKKMDELATDAHLSSGVKNTAQRILVSRKHSFFHASSVLPYYSHQMIANSTVKMKHFYINNYQSPTSLDAGFINHKIFILPQLVFRSVSILQYLDLNPVYQLHICDVI